MSQLKKQFGKRVQYLCTQAKITQEELARKLGVTVESAGNIERGVYGPTFSNLEKIALVLRVPVMELFDFK